jgi:hypothetical protein
VSLTHHYSVTRVGGDPVDRWFHTFEEADACFGELAASAASDGLEPAGESYWRKRFRGPDGGPVTLALDDRGLAPCDPDREG